MTQELAIDYTCHQVNINLLEQPFLSMERNTVIILLKDIKKLPTLLSFKCKCQLYLFSKTQENASIWSVTITPTFVLLFFVIHTLFACCFCYSDCIVLHCPKFCSEWLYNWLALSFFLSQPRWGWVLDKPSAFASPSALYSIVMLFIVFYWMFLCLV